MRQRIVESDPFLDEEKTKPFVTICAIDGEDIKYYDSIAKAMTAFVNDKVIEKYLECNNFDENKDEIVWRGLPAIHMREFNDRQYYLVSARLIVNKL